LSKEPGSDPNLEMSVVRRLPKFGRRLPKFGRRLPKFGSPSRSHLSLSNHIPADRNQHV